MATTTVLVTGATGFVGRRLVPTLVERGFHVRAMTRHPDDYSGEAEPVGGDVHDADSLAGPLLGVDVAVYLVHSLDSVDFERRDADAARAFGRVAAEAGVRQIVYLGGLGREDDITLPAPALATPGRGPSRRRRGASDGAARRHHRWRWRNIMGADPSTDQEPAGDDRAKVGRN